MSDSASALQLVTTDAADGPQWTRDKPAIVRMICSTMSTFREVERDSVTYAYMVLKLIRLHMVVRRHEMIIEDGIWDLVLSLWQNKITSMPRSENTLFLLSMVISEAHENIFNNMNKLEKDKIEEIAEILPYVIVPLESANVPLECEELVEFTRRLFAFPSGDNFHRLEYHAMKTDIINGRLNCPCFNENEILKRIVSESFFTELKREEIIRNAYECLFKTYYLKAIILRRIKAGKHGDQDVKHIWCNGILKHKYFQEEFIRLLQSYVVMNTLHEKYAFILDYDIIQLVTHEMQNFIATVISELDNPLRKNIFEVLSDRSRNIGYYWAYAARYFENKISKEDINDTGTEIHSKHENTSTLDLSDSAKSSNENSASEEFQIESKKPKESMSDIHYMQAKFIWGECDDDHVLRTRFYAATRSFNQELYHHETMCYLDCNPDALVYAYRRHKHIILTNSDFSTAPWAKVVNNAALADYLSEVVSKYSPLTTEQLHFVDKTLFLLMRSLERSIENWGRTKVAIISRATINLFNALRRSIPTFPDEIKKVLKGTHVKYDVVPKSTQRMLRIIVAVIENEHSMLSVAHMATLDALIQTLRYISLDMVPSAHAPVEPPADYLVNEALNALRGYRHPSVKLLAFHLLRVVSHSNIITDNVKLLQWSVEQSESKEKSAAPPLSVVAFEDALTHLQKIVDNALSPVKLCEKTFNMAPFSFNHGPILGYLMMSIALYEQTDLAKDDLVQHYIKYFREHDYEEYWMRIALRLLPQEMLDAANETNNTHPPTEYSKFFANTPEIKVEEACQVTTVRALACRCLFGVLGGVGVKSASRWWARAPEVQSRVTARLVEKYISAPMRDRQFQDVTRRAHLLPGADVFVNPETSEASCRFKFNDETKMVDVVYSAKHPLVSPRICYLRGCGGPHTTETNYWLNGFLREQHSLFDAFELWMSSVKASSQSMLKCFICYCTRHLDSGELPSVNCPKCVNQFHLKCTMWRNCPICQQAQQDGERP